MARKKTSAEKKPEVPGIPLIISQYCAEEWLPLFRMNCSILKFSKGDKIFAEGHPVSGMHFIIHGKAKVFIAFDQKKEYIVRLAGENAILGLRGYGVDYYPASSIALTDLEAYFIPIGIFNSLLKGNINFCLYFLNLVSQELRRGEEHLKDVAHQEIKERMAKALLLNIETFGMDQKDKNMLSYTLSRRDLASLAGTTYETTIRVLTDLEKQKIIRLEGKQIRILQLAKLQLMASVKN